MTIFYLYLNWFGSLDRKFANQELYLLTCESRYVADEFFRALKGLRSSGRKRWYMLLERKTPQLWCFTPIDDKRHYPFAAALARSDLLKFRPTVMWQLLSNGESLSPHYPPIIPPLDGPDWVNNGTYFIRNKRQPKLYWYHVGSYIRVSDTRKTKFRIRDVDLDGDDESVLVRSDVVEISLLDNGTNEMFLVKSKSGRLMISLDPRQWGFHRFLDGFGTMWKNEGDVEFEYVIATDADEADEWELC